jgi:hypothetical protein
MIDPTRRRPKWLKALPRRPELTSPDKRWQATVTSRTYGTPTVSDPVTTTVVRPKLLPATTIANADERWHGGSGLEAHSRVLHR